MLVDRQRKERIETQTLSPYAQKVVNSAGRVYPEAQHPLRTAYQRDRARIVHSRAFRRLEYKTQVFLNGTGDHLRTRLTHTMEVASVSRTVASALGLNEDLAEAIALAHDLGHAPFGHAGEEMLNELMKGEGGFEHNIQSLRVVDEIESVYPGFSGLNLSYEVREGLRKHDQGYDRPAFLDRPAESFLSPSLEGQVANLADEITYYSHDIDDGLDRGLITTKQLESDVEIWAECSEHVRSVFPDLEGDAQIRYVIRHLLDLEVNDVVAATHERLVNQEIDSADDVRRTKGALVGYSGKVRRQNAQMRKWLYQNLYFHEEVAEANQRGRKMLASVFESYIAEPKMVGVRTSARVEEIGVHRAVCDYISGMTDRYLMEEFSRLEGKK